MQKSININIYVFVRKSQQYLWEDTQETSSSGHLQRRLQRELPFKNTLLNSVPCESIMYSHKLIKHIHTLLVPRTKRKENWSLQVREGWRRPPSPGEDRLEPASWASEEGAAGENPASPPSCKGNPATAGQLRNFSISRKTHDPKSLTDWWEEVQESPRVWRTEQGLCGR